MGLMNERKTGAKASEGKKWHGSSNKTTKVIVSKKEKTCRVARVPSRIAFPKIDIGNVCTALFAIQEKQVKEIELQTIREFSGVKVSF